MRFTRVSPFSRLSGLVQHFAAYSRSTGRRLFGISLVDQHLELGCSVGLESPSIGRPRRPMGWRRGCRLEHCH